MALARARRGDSGMNYWPGFVDALSTLILSIIFMVQVSMNFNASVYGNAIVPLTKRYGITEQYARVGQLVFLVAYAFGCELWAPWSEELGRRPILQWSLGLVNLWQIPCALAPK